MEKIVKLLTATGAMWMLLASNLFAGPTPPPFEGFQTTTTLYIHGDGQPAGYRDPNSKGGEFSAVFPTSSFSTYILDHYSSEAKATITIGGIQHTGIETFCVEMTQTFSADKSYNAEVGGSAITPGSSQALNYLTMGTAYLYSQFAQGLLTTPTATYNYNGEAAKVVSQSRAYSADELQDAIWYLQGEMNSGNQSDWSGGSLAYQFNINDPTSDPFVCLAEQVCGGLAGAQLDDSNCVYGVQVLELTTSTGSAIQDQLVYCPVPEPATFAAGAVLLAPLGWSLLRILRKKDSSDLAAIFSDQPKMAPVRERSEDRQPTVDRRYG